MVESKLEPFLAVVVVPHGQGWVSNMTVMLNRTRWFLGRKQTGRVGGGLGPQVALVEVVRTALLYQSMEVPRPCSLSNGKLTSASCVQYV